MKKRPRNRQISKGADKINQLKNTTNERRFQVARDYVSDSSDIFAYKERLKERELQRIKKCDDCFEPIQENHFYETDEGDLCEECFNEYIERFKKSCRKRVENNELL